ncbi:MAG: SHOCT domain-containing protein [Bacilli bacterium]|nr:SHOCT domain-containing protein [Bacilli bacterium]
MQEHVTMEVYDNDWIATSNTMACFGFYKEGSSQEELAKFWLNGGGEVSEFCGPVFGKEKEDYLREPEFPRYSDLNELFRSFNELKGTYKRARSQWKYSPYVVSFVSFVCFTIITLSILIPCIILSFQSLILNVILISFGVILFFVIAWHEWTRRNYNASLVHMDEYNDHLDDQLQELVERAKNIMLDREMQTYFRNVLSKNNPYSTQKIVNTSIDANKEELIRLKKLFDDGLIDEDEYKQKKAQILGL